MAAKFKVIEYSLSPEGVSLERAVAHNLSRAVADKRADELNDKQTLAIDEIKSYTVVYEWEPNHLPIKVEDGLKGRKSFYNTPAYAQLQRQGEAPCIPLN